MSSLIAVFYFWTATSSNQPFHTRDTSQEFYGQLTESLLKGHVYLPEKPSAELLALPDPYNPLASMRYRLHDASLYKGRYYLYFGIGPVAVLYVPWRWLTGGSLSDDIAVSVFSFGGFLFSCLLLFLLLKASRFRVPWFLQLCAVLVLGLGQVAPIVLRRPKVYEVAVSAGFCFLLGGFYFLARRILNPQSGRWLTALSAVCLGLAVASRPQFSMLASLLAVGYGIHLFQSARRIGRPWKAEWARFVVPLAIAAVLIGWYNYARFDNPMEFGTRYQTGAYNLRAEAITGRPLATRLGFAFASLYYSLICPPSFLGRFPFFEMTGAAPPFGSPELIPENYLEEPVAGSLLISPLCLAGLLFPFLAKKRRFPPEITRIVGGLLVCGVVALFALCDVPGATGRYGLDYLPSLLVAGLFLCAWLYSDLPAGWMRTTVAACTVAGCLWAAAMNMALSVNSYGYPLEQPYSARFRSIATLFGAGQDALMEDVSTLHLDATITFAHAKPGTREAIFTTGIWEQADLIFVQYQPNDQAVFSYVKTGQFETDSPAIQLSPGRPYHLAMNYSATEKRLVVRLDDRVILAPSTVLFATSRDRIVLGRVRLCRFRLRDFSGRMDVPPGGLQFSSRHLALARETPKSVIMRYCGMIDSLPGEPPAVGRRAFQGNRACGKTGSLAVGRRPSLPTQSPLLSGSVYRFWWSFLA